MSTRISSSSSSSGAAAESLQTDLALTLNQCSWSMLMLTPPPTGTAPARPLPPPFLDNDERYEIDVIKLHPSFNRVAYTSTRSLHDKHKPCRDGGGGDIGIGETRIIVQDFDVISATTGNSPMTMMNGGETGTNDDPKMVASFTLNELNAKINEFQNEQCRIMNLSERRKRHNNNSSNNIRSETRTKCTVQMLGTVKNIDFLSHNDIRHRIDAGSVGKVRGAEVVGPLNIHHQRLIISFRHSIVVASIDLTTVERTNYVSDSIRGKTRGLNVIAYIGPDNTITDACCEDSHLDEKALKKFPSSFPVPISETMIAYGCYDGGVRFYDIHRQKIVKSCLGPNGRGNPIVKLILVNRVDPNSVLRNNYMNSTTCIRRPRIISVSATGDAYLWELELSIDRDNVGEVVRLNVPPPLATMDGLVALVSGNGMPVLYPPALSSSNISSLSPLSSWELIDEVNSQFEVSYDPQHDLFCWVFSPDCVGSSLKPQSSWEERLNMNCVMVCWKLTELPIHSEWPPPVLPPHCVVQLPRTKNGRVSTDMVAGPGLMWDHQFLSTFYITSSDELMVVKADVNERGQSIHLESRASMLKDLKTFASNDKKGFTCFGVAATSIIDQPMIAIGTQFGVLIATITRESLHVHSEMESVKHRASSSSVDRFSDEQRQTLLAERVQELECRNKELEFQLDEMIQEAHDTFSDKEFNGLQSQLQDVLETELGTALVTIARLENEVREKNDSCEVLESKISVLEADLARGNEELVKERHINQATMRKLAAAEEIGLAIGMQNELSNAKEYITRLEAQVKAKDNELMEAKQQAVEFSHKHSELIANVEAQDLALESLVHLLELQRDKYEKNYTARHDEIIVLRDQ